MRIEVKIERSNSEIPQISHYEGDQFHSGVGKWRIVPGEGANHCTFELSAIDSLAFARNVRHMASIRPGESFTIVRPTASMTVKNCTPND